MKVALIYPPPWRIAAPGAPPYALGGPPAEYREGDLDADFYQTPYGLFALGAAAMRAGHAVKVLNLSAVAWPEVERCVRELGADVYGLSCWTANRRGVAYTAEAIKSAVPHAKVVVGGPHATPLANEMLAHHTPIDIIMRGESDVTFVEYLERLEQGHPLTAIAGTTYRVSEGATKGSIVTADKRKNIDDLDTLACPQHAFTTHILMTSRGCPWACTFCGAETSWGRGFRSNSIEYVLDAIATVLPKLPVKMIQIKDDTFTTNKKRVFELCQRIRERKLDFLWSCDTRVDLLDEDLLREMRLAGCSRLSLGVESGSQAILDAIDKKITPDEILHSTAMAKRVGIKVRYYMMLGNRGETRATFAETLAFLERAQPHEYVFSCLSIYPGTRDFTDAEHAGTVSRAAYFAHDFQELKTPFDAKDDDVAWMNEWFQANIGLRTVHVDSLAETQDILARLGEYHAAHMDVAAAAYREGAYDLAKTHVERALALHYPLPGLAYNHLACIAKAQGDLDAMMNYFTTAAQRDPTHFVLIRNVERARAWFRAGGAAKNLPLELEVRHDFQLLERTMQPTLPGPLPADLADWSNVPTLPEAAEHFVRTPEQEGSGRGMKRLRVL